MKPHKEPLGSFGVTSHSTHALKSPLPSLILGPIPDIVASQTFLVPQ